MLKFLFIISIFFCICCKRNTQDEIIQVKLNDDLVKILTEICNGDDYSQCENEIFIDRISPDSTRFTIRIGGYKVKHLPRPFPIMMTTINSIPFNIYTGAEQYISRSGKFKYATEIDPPYNCSEEITTIIEKNGKYIVKYYGGEPFNYYPDYLIPDTLIFLPPDGKVDH